MIIIVNLYWKLNPLNYTKDANYHPAGIDQFMSDKDLVDSAERIKARMYLNPKCGL